MKLPLRTYLYPLQNVCAIEDADGKRIVSGCFNVVDAKLIVTAVNAFDGIDLTVLPDGAMHFEAKPQVSAAAELIDQLERKAIRFELALQKIAEMTKPGSVWQIGAIWSIANGALTNPEPEQRSTT